jgi:hypothetical protein
MSTSKDGGLTVTGSFHMTRSGRGGRQETREGPQPVVSVGRVPRVARLMALAIRFDGLVRSCEIADHATLARLGHVTRARVSQIMSLLHLAPDVQEAILFLPPVERGRDPLVLRDLLPIATTPDWRAQRKRWAALGRAKIRNPRQPT